MSTDLVRLTADGTAVTTSHDIAVGTENEHASVIKLVRLYLADLEEFGGVGFEIEPFETPGGVQRREIAVLNEEHATLLLTYMRNNVVVRDFKKRLVRQFWELSRRAMPTHAEALRSWAAELERAELAEAKVVELTAPASAWTELAEAQGDYAVADAAKVLSRDPNINIGRDRLFTFMQGLRWVYRDKGWRAYQAQVDNGRLTEKVAKPYWHEGRGEYVNGTPTVRITPKGLQELHKRLGGTGQLALVAAS